ncbi:Ras-associated and pleckstrin y domains-containing protein 1 [Loxospora ochrophaea]|nr:Ras-associated and pleckstrin y domains-containing protein 1 [Loxospora ochrophaea]
MTRRPIHPAAVDDDPAPFRIGSFVRDALLFRGPENLPPRPQQGRRPTNGNFPPWRGPLPTREEWANYVHPNQRDQPGAQMRQDPPPSIQEDFERMEPRHGLPTPGHHLQPHASGGGPPPESQHRSRRSASHGRAPDATMFAGRTIGPGSQAPTGHAFGERRMHSSRPPRHVNFGGGSLHGGGAPSLHGSGAGSRGPPPPPPPPPPPGSSMPEGMRHSHHGSRAGGRGAPPGNVPEGTPRSHHGSRAGSQAPPPSGMPEGVPRSLHGSRAGSRGPPPPAPPPPPPPPPSSIPERRHRSRAGSHASQTPEEEAALLRGRRMPRSGGSHH